MSSTLPARRMSVKRAATAKHQNATNGRYGPRLFGAPLSCAADMVDQQPGERDAAAGVKPDGVGAEVRDRPVWDEFNERAFTIKQKKRALERLCFAGMTVVTFKGRAGFRRQMCASGG